MRNRDKLILHALISITSKYVKQLLKQNYVSTFFINMTSVCVYFKQYLFITVPSSIYMSNFKVLKKHTNIKLI